MAALAVGPFLYRSLLPEAEHARAPGCGFVLVIAGLLALLVGAAIWQLRRRRRPTEREMDKRLWEAVMGRDQEPPSADEE